MLSRAISEIVATRMRQNGSFLGLITFQLSFSAKIKAGVPL